MCGLYRQVPLYLCVRGNHSIRTYISAYEYTLINHYTIWSHIRTYRLYTRRYKYSLAYCHMYVQLYLCVCHAHILMKAGNFNSNSNFIILLHTYVYIIVRIFIFVSFGPVQFMHIVKCKLPLWSNSGFVIFSPCVLQWNLFIKDTLVPANLSTVERLSTLQR